MNEAETRAEYIDKQLEASGWITSGEISVRREFPISPGEIRSGGIRTGKLKADYVLCYKNCKLAVVEAKSIELEVGEGVAQAKLYAQKLDLEYSFAANGKEIYQICTSTGEESLVDAFPAPKELWEKTFAKSNYWMSRFIDIPFEDLNGLKKPRYYQEIAVNKVLNSIANDKKRILLTLATGTGKTFIAFQIAWKLFKSRWNKNSESKRSPRILFLADRNILANQAFLDFGSFSDDALVRIDPNEINKKGLVPKNASVFFTIFQTFMSGKDGKNNYGEYSPDFFDLIIIDECHRGGASDESSWREILHYFDSAVHLGLTATPKRDNNVDTYNYFGEPVYIYSLKEGIKDGFLTPFKVKRIQSSIDEYVYSSDDEIVDGEVIEDKVYTEREFNKKIVIEDRERKRVQEMLSSINQKEKTLVFCANQPHAALVRDLINQETPYKEIDYCVRVTANDGNIGDMYLKRFKDNEKIIPTIITTSKKLTTGVDARNIRNIVLLRPINNMVEFKQIIGRGTRLFDGKYFFTIIDFVNAFHMFSDIEWDGLPSESIDEENGYENNDESTENDDEQGEENGDEDEGNVRNKLKIQLADGKFREIKSISSTFFYFDGKPISPQEFLKKIFNMIQIPELFNSEEKLREIWANPLTRKDLLMKLENVGCYKDDLIKLQELINAEDSDIYDVLQYIAFAKEIISREKRVANNSPKIYTFLNSQEREFISYILRNYVQVGVEELDISKLSILLNAKYGSLNEAQKELGDVNTIKNTFIRFQKYLYEEVA